MVVLMAMTVRVAVVVVMSVVAVIVIVVVVMIVSVVMSSLRLVLVVMLMEMSVEILHVMIEKFPVLGQLYQKITDIQAGFFHSADMYLVRFLYGKRPQGLPQRLLICSQVQKRRHGHIAADAAGALKI